MAIYKHHPKRAKNCVFCNYWTGDANMKFINSVAGYEYDGNATGKCTIGAGTRSTPAVFSCGKNFEPNVAASKLL